MKTLFFTLAFLITADLLGQIFGPPGDGDYSASMSISPSGITEAREAPWYAPDYGFEPLYWNKEEISLEKKIAVLEHNLGRLRLTESMMPFLDKRISVSGESMSFPEIVKLIGEKIKKEITLDYQGDSSITYDFEITNYQVFVILEAFIEGTEDTIIYGEDAIIIKPLEPSH